jgi:hypothetical protein
MNKSVLGMLVLGFGALGGCASSGAIDRHGSVVMAADSVKAFAEGPAIVHAFSMDSGGRVFIAADRTGTDADCAAAASAGSAAVAVDQRNVLTLAQGQIACVATSHRKSYELMWHARPSQRDGGMILLAHTGR